MELRAGTFAFPKARDVELRTDDQSFNFNSPVRQAVAMLAGTKFGFSPRNDHHLGKVVFRLATAIDDDVVHVTGTFGSGTGQATSMMTTRATYSSCCWPSWNGRPAFKPFDYRGRAQSGDLVLPLDTRSRHDPGRQLHCTSRRQEHRRASLCRYRHGPKPADHSFGEWRVDTAPGCAWLRPGGVAERANSAAR